jgi:hypothetical protein
LKVLFCRFGDVEDRILNKVVLVEYVLDVAEIGGLHAGLHNVKGQDTEAHHHQDIVGKQCRDGSLLLYFVASAR